MKDNIYEEIISDSIERLKNIEFDQRLPDEVLEYLDNFVLDILRSLVYIRDYDYMSGEQKIEVIKTFCDEMSLGID